MYKGRYVALVEYDFNFDESSPNTRPIEHIREMFKSGMFETELANLLCDEVFDPRMGNCKVTQTFFDMYEVMNDDTTGSSTPIA